MKKNKKLKYIIITAVSLILTVFLVLFIKNTMAATKYSYSREALQNYIVSSALEYYYNSEYVDYEEYSMDKKEKDSTVFSEGSFYFRTLTTTPEMINRANRIHLDCDSFVTSVYINTLGYDFSKYYNITKPSDITQKVRSIYFEYEKNQGKDIKKYTYTEEGNVENFKTAYKKFAKGGLVPFSAIRDNADINDTNDIVEYKYVLPAGEETTEAEKNVIESTINEKLKPGDLITYHYDGNGHVLLYIGNKINKGEKGFIHTTGTDSALGIKNTNGEEYDITQNLSIGDDPNAIRYASMDDFYNMLNSKVFVKTKNDKNHYIAIYRPLNDLCNGEECEIKLKDNDLYSEATEEMMNNSEARTALENLRFEQFLKKENEKNPFISNYNSVNKNDVVTHQINIANKSILNYCSDTTSYNKESTCTSNGKEWKTSTRDKVNYNLSLEINISDDITYIENSCNGNCTEISENGKITKLKWENKNFSGDNQTTYEYYYKFIPNNADNKELDGFIVSTTENNEEYKLTMPNLDLKTNPTLVDSYKNDYFKNEVTSAETDLDYIKKMYNNNLGMNLTFDGENVVNSLFNKMNFGTNETPNYVYVKKVTPNDDLITKMLVPGLYGGRILKGNDGGDRIKYIRSTYFELGDIFICYNKQENKYKYYIFYGYDNSGNSIVKGYNNGEIIYDNSGEAGKSGYRIIKELPANDLFVVLRPTRVLNIYTVTLDKQNGSGGTDTIYENYGNNFSLDPSGLPQMKGGTSPTNPIEIPTRIGYTFDGYYTETNGNGTQIISSNGYIVSGKYSTFTSNSTIYAKWTPNIYTVTLDKQSGSGGTSTIYEKYGSNFSLSSSGTPKMLTDENPITKPTRTGYTFGGYYTETNGNGSQIISASGYIVSGKYSTFTSNSTIYAKWIDNPIIKFDSNGGKWQDNSTSILEKQVEYKKEFYFSSLPNITKTNSYGECTFKGWQEKDNDNIFKTYITPEKNREFTASWECPTEPEKYTITYNLNGGINNQNNPDEITANEELVLSNPTKEGYTFIGWYLDSNFNQKLANNTISIGTSDNITLYAKWIQVSSEDKIESLDEKIIIDKSNLIIKGLDINTKIDIFAPKLDTTYTVKYYDKNNQELVSTDIMKTGNIIKFINTKNESIDMQISVKGDTTGDGNINVMDIVDIAKHITKTKILNGVYYTSGDYDSNNTINVMDIVNIANKILSK